MILRSIALYFFIFLSMPIFGQTLQDVDTTGGFGKNLLSLYKKFDHLKFSGYMQPQFQVIDTVGAESFNGGNFSPYSNNRFMLRRGRLRLDYADYNKENQPTVALVFQMDGTERGFFARDFWGRVYENKLQCFALSAGIMVRPFGNELLYSSGDRESPERGRMSQILMRTERDLGMTITFEPRKKGSKFKFFKWDLMIGNGQGLTGATDVDSRKDFISRIAIKPQIVARNIKISGGISALYGGIRQFSSKSYAVQNARFVLEENIANIGRTTARTYFGADVQVKIPNGEGKGIAEFRAEYITGKQSALAKTSETPGVVALESDGSFSPLYTRSFNGAYFYYLQHLGSPKHQLILKYDWYDPNTKVRKTTLDNTFSAADVRYSTFGVGYIYYVNSNLKIATYYEVVKNEITALKGYNRDLKDNLFTCRMQVRF